MTQNNRSDSFGHPYAEYTPQHGNLYSVGYAVATSEVGGALSYFLSSIRSSIRRALIRRAAHKPGQEAATVPEYGKAAAEA